MGLKGLGRCYHLRLDQRNGRGRSPWSCTSSAKDVFEIWLDEDIIEHFKREGKGYQSRINAVLKAYVLAQQMKEGE